MIHHDIGKRVWHRVFGWCTITHPYTSSGQTLITSDHKHIRQYVMGKGWIEYLGNSTEDGRIAAIFVHKDELFDEPQNDSTQALLKVLVKVVE